MQIILILDFICCSFKIEFYANSACYIVLSLVCKAVRIDELMYKRSDKNESSSLNQDSLSEIPQQSIDRIQV